MAAYSTGTITLNCGTSQINGSGTSFVGNVSVGGYILVPGMPKAYKILQVIDNLTLQTDQIIPGPVGNSVSGLIYFFSTDFTPVLGLPMPSIGVVNMQALVNRALIVLDNELPKLSTIPISKQIVSGTLTTLGQTSSIFAPSILRSFDVVISTATAFVGSVALWRSFDGGVTWQPITEFGRAVYYWTSPASERVQEPENNVLYQLICTVHTSGTITYTISQ